MDSAAIVLAVVGGWIFSSAFRITQLRIAQAKGYELAFLSIAFAYVFFQLSCLLLYPAFSETWTFEGFIALWTSPIDNRLHVAIFRDLIGSLLLFKGNPIPPSVAAFFMGALLWWPANKFLRRVLGEVVIIAYLVDRYGSELDELLLNSMLLGRQVQITLDTGKVYAGKVVQLPRLDRADRDPGLGLTLVVSRSGYRAEKTHKICFTTPYDWIYDPSNPASVTEFETFVPLHRIVSAAYFDPDLYDRFQQQPSPDPPPDAPPPAPRVPFKRRYAS